MMLSSARCSVQDTLLPCMTVAPRQPLRAFNRAFTCSCNRHLRQTRIMTPDVLCCRAQGVHAQRTDPAKQKIWPILGVLSSLLANPRAATADEVTTAAGDAAQAATKATADLPPTVTFGGSFGQYDPIIAFFFYAVIAALTVLTLGVGYLSIRNWQDSTDEKKERAAFSRSSEKRELANTSAKSKTKRRPPKSKSSDKGFG